MDERVFHEADLRAMLEDATGLVEQVSKPGTYAVFVSVGQRDGTPRIGLPLDQDDGQHRYRLGSIRLEP